MDWNQNLEGSLVFAMDSGPNLVELLVFVMGWGQILEGLLVYVVGGRARFSAKSRAAAARGGDPRESPFGMPGDPRNPGTPRSDSESSKAPGRLPGGFYAPIPRRFDISAERP